MDITRRKASAFQVVTTDYPIEIVATFIIVLPVVYFFSQFDSDPQSGAETFFIKAIAILLTIGVIRSGWKLRRVTQIFARGIEVIGTVTALSSYRYTTITCSYTYHRQAYSTKEYIARTKRTHSLKTGSQVVLVVNASNPQQAVIRDLYISDEDFAQNLSEFERLSTGTTR